MRNTGWPIKGDDDFPPPLDLRDGETWASGLDVSINTEVVPDKDILTKDFLEHVHVNDIVNDDFAYKNGMDVCMAVYTLTGPNSEEEVEKSPGSERLITNILGSAHECVVFTGKITHVGEKHIEYDMNSFGNCSGAAVYLLVKDHDEYGKVIAVHVGSKPPPLDTNLGFKLAKAFETLY